MIVQERSLLSFSLEAALLLPTQLEWTDVKDYREELICTLSTARSLAVDVIQKSQNKYKKYFDKQSDYRIGDQVLVRFPSEELGKMRKLSQPWHGPYRIMARKDPDVTVTKSYFSKESRIQIHQSRICPCPLRLPIGYFGTETSVVLLVDHRNRS